MRPTRQRWATRRLRLWSRRWRQAWTAWSHPAPRGACRSGARLPCRVVSGAGRGGGGGGGNSRVVCWKAATPGAPVRGSFKRRESAAAPPLGRRHTPPTKLEKKKWTPMTHQCANAFHRGGGGEKNPPEARGDPGLGGEELAAAGLAVHQQPRLFLLQSLEAHLSNGKKKTLNLAGGGGGRIGLNEKRGGT